MKLAARVSALCLFALLAGLAVDLVVRGAGGFDGAYLRNSVTDAGRAGGVAPVLVSTCAVVLISLAVAAPLSLAAAVLCIEVLRAHRRLAMLARRSCDVLVSVPSVAVGLAGWMLLCRGLGLSFSLLSGGLTLAVMMIPVMTVAFASGLESSSARLRADGLALGLTRWQALWLLTLPAARPALIAGVVLAVGRATAETAALVLTSGISTRAPGSILDPGATLAVHVYHMARNVPGGEPAAYRAALLLLVVNVLLHAALATLRRRRIR